MIEVNGPTSAPCIPGATIQSGGPNPDCHGTLEELPCENRVSRYQIPWTVVSLYPDGGRSRSSE